MHPGDIVYGIVFHVTIYHVYVRLTRTPALIGTIHNQNIGWSRDDQFGDLDQRFSPGDSVEARVLSIRRSGLEVSLSIKTLTQDPWLTYADVLTIGHTLPGRVVSITDDGLFVELFPGVEGVIFCQELGWTSRERWTSTQNIGDVLWVELIHVDLEHQRLSLRPVPDES
ncbi:MAG: S1 RNA-binding domain-containing protein [Bradymonadia bacterium]